MEGTGNRRDAYLLVGLAVLIWSTIPVILKTLTYTYTPLQINFYTYFFAALGALFFILFNDPKRVASKMTLRVLWLLGFAAFIGMFAYELLLTKSMVLLPSTTANIINYFWPVLMIPLAALLLKEKFTPLNLFAGIIGFAGVALLASDSDVQLAPVGAALAFAAAFLLALFNVLQKKFAFQKHSSIMVMIIIAFLFFLVVTAGTGDFVVAPVSDLVLFLYLGMLPVTFGITLYIDGLCRGNTAEIANLSFATPFIALVWSNAILGEPILAQHVAALALFFTGILIQSHFGRSAHKIH